MKNILLVMAIFLLPAHLASGQTEIPASPVFPMDGAQFLRFCPPIAEMTYTSFAVNGIKNPDFAAIQATLCLGFVSGLAEGFNTHPELDWDISGKPFGQVYDAVSGYIQKHPESQKQPILSIVELTFARPAKTSK